MLYLYIVSKNNHDFFRHAEENMLEAIGLLEDGSVLLTVIKNLGKLYSDNER